MRKNSLKSALLSGLLACASMLPVSGVAFGQTGPEAPIPVPFCTDATLRGAYAYSRTGTFVRIGPVAANGVVTFDGQGLLFGADTASINGKISQRRFDGKYAINGDCTGEAVLAFSDRELVNIAFQIVEDGQEIRFIQTDAGTVVTGDAKQISDLFRLLPE